MVQSNFINERFPGFNYNFYAYIPSWSCVPLGIWLTQFFSKYHMNTRIITTTICICCSVVLTMLVTVHSTQGSWEGKFPKINLLGFLGMMALNFISFTFLSIFQANIVCISTIYGGDMTILFYLAQPISNLSFSGLRFIFIYFGLKPEIDVNFFLLIFYLVSNNDNFIYFAFYYFYNIAICY